MIVHLVDGTYELFRHFYGLRRFRIKGFASRGSPGRTRANGQPRERTLLRGAGGVRRRHSRSGRIGWKRRGCSSVAKRLRPDDDALIAAHRRHFALRRRSYTAATNERYRSARDAIRDSRIAASANKRPASRAEARLQRPA